jgi:transposase
MMGGSVARELADVGLGEIVRQLSYKAEWGGRTIVKVDRFYPSSKTCHVCEHIQKIGSREIWTCDGCGTLHHRDQNASVNIRRRGLEIAVGQGMAEPIQQWMKVGGDSLVLSQSVAKAAGLAVQTGVIGTLPLVRSAEFPECLLSLLSTPSGAL